MNKDIFDMIKKNQGKPFHLENGETFFYTVNNDEIFIKQKNWKISRSDIEAAVKYQKSITPKPSDSKKLSYIFAVLEQIQN